MATPADTSKMKRMNGNAKWIFGICGSLVVLGVVAFAAHMMNSVVHENRETKVNRINTVMQKFYTDQVKPDLAQMKSDLVREIQMVKK